MTSISNSKNRHIRRCIQHLQSGYQSIYGDYRSPHIDLVKEIATSTLEAIARSDAAYHNLEHTMLVTLVGQEILYGKHLCKETISSDEWLNFIVSLLCHDIGYLKGICRDDCMNKHTFSTGVNGGRVTLSASATDASLTPYHVDRSKQFVAENFEKYSLIDVEVVQVNIELTRFPVPKDDLHQDTRNNPGLVRAADLIGQLGDSGYLAKLPALFSEFEETGGNKALGYRHPNDLRTGYPKFYWRAVYPYLRHGIRYLEVSQPGKAILANLYHNLSVVENELMLAIA